MSGGNIKGDVNRFHQIVKGKIKKELGRFISRGELIGKKGSKGLVSIPLRQIELPRFRFGKKGNGAVGEGEGEVGTLISPQEGEAQGAGDLPGYHLKEVELTIEELAEILGEELELPNIRQRGKKNIFSEQRRYTTLGKVGPNSLIHFKRTYKEALKRQLISGSFDLKKPKVIPIKDDYRYRSWKTKLLPETNAVIIYMLDVSGSMFGEPKEIVRLECFWIDVWLRHQYKGLETRYLVHEAEAWEVDRETFFSITTGGGTVISSVLKLCSKIVKENYPVEEWNIYLFHFSDGDNFSKDDNEQCVEIMRKDLLPKVNLFGYGQVENAYGSGDFIDYLEDKLVGEFGNLILSQIAGKGDVYKSIKAFLGKGL
jgi:hypothetical protein